MLGKAAFEDMGVSTAALSCPFTALSPSSRSRILFTLSSTMFPSPGQGWEVGWGDIDVPSQLWLTTDCCVPVLTVALYREE